MSTEHNIMEACIRVFTKSGYLGSSTKTIAAEAGVAEVTLFRKYNSKKQLFESMLEYALGSKLSSTYTIDTGLPLDQFTGLLLHSRLLLISEQISLVRLIIQESLQGRLPETLNFIQTMSDKFSTLFEKCFLENNLEVDPSLSKNILGIILHYAILESHLNYHLLTAHEQQTYISEKLQSIRI